MEEVFRQSGAGGGARETGRPAGIEVAAAGKPMDPQRRINLAVNCFSRFRGLARFEGRETNSERCLETQEDKITV